MIYTLLKCDGCGKEDRVEQFSTYPPGWIPLRFMIPFSSMVLPEYLACSRECAGKALPKVIEALYEKSDKEQAK